MNKENVEITQKKYARRESLQHAADFHFEGPAPSAARGMRGPEALSSGLCAQLQDVLVVADADAPPEKITSNEIVLELAVAVVLVLVS